MSCPTASNPAARNTVVGSALATTARTDGNAAIAPSSHAAAQPITIVSARLARGHVGHEPA